MDSTNMLNEKYILECDLTYSLHKLAGRWKLLILCRLEEGKLRFSELRDRINGITERMLTLQLKELEKDLLIKRTTYAEVPPRVEYELTDIAKQLVHIWRPLEAWSRAHKTLVENNQNTSSR